MNTRYQYNPGWECPKCGRVYAPLTPMCLYCGDKTITKTANTLQEDEDVNKTKIS